MSKSLQIKISKNKRNLLSIHQKKTTRYDPSSNKKSELAFANPDSIN